MNIAFTLTMDDLMAFNLHHQRHSPTAKRAFRKNLLLFPLIWTSLCLVLSRLATTPERSWPVAILGLLPLFMGAPLYLVTFPLLHRRAIRRQLQGFLEEENNSSMLGPHRIETTPEGLGETSDSGHTQLTWDAIKRVEVAKDHVFLYRGAMSAFVVPKRSFTDQTQLAAFLDEVNHYRQLGGKDGSPGRC